MARLKIAAVALGLILGSTIPVTGQGETAGPADPAPPSAEPSASATIWLDEQTCTDPNLRMPVSASGTTTGDMGNCARRLGLRKRDPEYDDYDFRLWKRTSGTERWTEQCDDAGNHISSRYHAFGTDRLYNIEKPDRIVEGTFDFRVVGTRLDSVEDIWQVEKQGALWDLQATDGDRGWTWSVDVTWVSDGAPEEPVLTQYRGVEPSEFAKVLCDYLK